MERAQNFRIAFHIHNVDRAVIIYTQLCLRNPHRNSEPFPIARMPEDRGDKISRKRIVRCDAEGRFNISFKFGSCHFFSPSSSGGLIHPAAEKFRLFRGSVRGCKA